MKVLDERMASAVGPRGHNVQRPANKLGDDELAIQMTPGDSVGGVVGGGGGGKWRLQMPSPTSSMFIGPLSCSIILFLIALSVFGLEIYRIREINDLAQRTEILEKDLDVLRKRTSQPNLNSWKLPNEDEFDLVKMDKDGPMEKIRHHLLEDTAAEKQELRSWRDKTDFANED